MRVESGKTTVGDFISTSLRKEILHVWLQQDPAPLDREVVNALVETWAPTVADKLLKLVHGWIPGLLLSIDSPLADFRKASGDDGVDVAASYVAEPARLTITESLQMFFETVQFAAVPPGGSVLALQPHLMERLPSWLKSPDFRLPYESVFCLSAEIGPVLLRAPRDELLLEKEAIAAAAGEDGAALAAGSAVAACRREVKALPGSREEVLSQRLEMYQKRIFRLESELMARSQSEKEHVASEKNERAKAEARLMEINSQLEERLKARSEELRKTNEKLAEAQKGMDDTRALLEDKIKQISKFEYKEEHHKKMEEEYRENEKKLTKRLLRLAMQEDTIKQREQFRMEKLKGYVKGEEMASAQSDSHSDIKYSAVLDKMEDDFERTYKTRTEKFETALLEFNQKLEEKRSQYNFLNKEVQKMAAASRKRTDTSGAIQSDAEQVADLVLGMDSQDLLVLLQSDNRLKNKISEAIDKSSSGENQTLTQT